MKKNSDTSVIGSTVPSRIRRDVCLRILRETIEHKSSGATFGLCQTPIKGLCYHRHLHTTAPLHHFYKPVIILIVQGKKTVTIGSQQLVCEEESCFLCGVHMPVTSCAIQASPSKPYLSLSLWLDIDMINEMAAKLPLQSSANRSLCAAKALTVSDDLLDAFVRLAQLADNSELLPVLAEPLLQEFHAMLLQGAFGGILRTLASTNSQAHQISRAINWLKEHFREPLNLDDLARASNMGRSTFFRYFKDLTAETPLQYQKRLRLMEAQRLLLSESCDVGSAAYAVGYESYTQFIREYKRFYGEPPMKNLQTIRKVGRQHLPHSS